jgi:hypothetical protein
MAEVDLQKEIAEISLNKTGEGDARETVLATFSQTDPSGEKLWLFRGWKTSSMFELALGENWHYRVYAEPYKPLWADTIQMLKARDTTDPVLIDLDIKYEWIENRRIAVHLRNTSVREIDPGEEFGLL